MKEMFSNGQVNEEENLAISYVKAIGNTNNQIKDRLDELDKLKNAMNSLSLNSHIKSEQKEDEDYYIIKESIDYILVNFDRLLNNLYVDYGYNHELIQELTYKLEEQIESKSTSTNIRNEV